MANERWGGPGETGCYRQPCLKYGLHALKRRKHRLLPQGLPCCRGVGRRKMRPLTILSVQFSRCQPCPASSFPCNGPSGHFFESHMGTATRGEQ